MRLSQFAEEIESASGFTAYRMDNTANDMRGAAGLGTCECCDYVTVSKDGQSVVLIEETDLGQTIVAFKQRHGYLNDEDQTALLYEDVLREHRLKLYGSMLVLCRLSSWWARVKAFLITTTDSSDSSVLLDHLRDKLRNFLKSTLKKEMLTEVDIIPSTELDRKLSDDVIQID
ncbi:MAG: hypothetical protein F4X51_00255 [Gemmatimonadetes bacterium]|nr:hypothetical protein [Gemmatimonadota bacterium]